MPCHSLFFIIKIPPPSFFSNFSFPFVTQVDFIPFLFQRIRWNLSLFLSLLLQKTNVSLAILCRRGMNDNSSFSSSCFFTFSGVVFLTFYSCLPLDFPRLQASVESDTHGQKEGRGRETNSSASGRPSVTDRVNSIRSHTNGKSSTGTASVVILTKGHSSSTTGNKVSSSSNGLLIRQLSHKSSNGSNGSNNNNNVESNGAALSRKKRPPTPPRKPKINPQNFPGLQFMGKEGFGVADNLSTPPNSTPVSPTDGLEEASPSSPVSNDSITHNNNNNRQQYDSDSPAQATSSPSSTSCTTEMKPLITASKVIELIGSKSSERKASVTDIPAPVDSDTPLLRVLSDMERGSNHSLVSADLEETDLNPAEEALRDELLKSEENSVNEDLSLHDELTVEVSDLGVDSVLFMSFFESLIILFTQITSSSF